SALCALASISRCSSFSAPLTASTDTCRRSSSRARLADDSISAWASAFWRVASTTASSRAASTIWLARAWAWSMISLALARASFSSSLTLSCAWARSFWLRSAAARPSAIFCWRSSSALSSGGQMKVAISQIRPAKASAWANRVRLRFMVTLCLCSGSLRRVRRKAAYVLPPRPRCGPAADPSDRLIRQLRGQAADQERAGEGEQQADGDRDDERGVDQAGGDEHAHLQDRDQLRLAGGRLEELAGHD